MCSVRSALYFAQAKLEAYIKETPHALISKLYIDVGDNESRESREDFLRVYVNSNVEIVSALRAIGYNDNCLRFEVIKGGTDTEASWNARLNDVICYLFDELK